jgi:hypothetical protein
MGPLRRVWLVLCALCTAVGLAGAPPSASYEKFAPLQAPEAYNPSGII